MTLFARVILFVVIAVSLVIYLVVSIRREWRQRRRVPGRGSVLVVRRTR
jgi:hypothetical protein